MPSHPVPRQRGSFERTRDHWWWREGWGPGTRYLTWHLTFEGATALHEAAERAGKALSTVTGVDVVPVEWLHLTMTGVGHSGDLDPVTLNEHVDSVFSAASRASIVPLAFDPALTLDSEIVMPVQINGKKRGDLTIARDADQVAVEKAALALDVVQKALEGKQPRKVIVVPQRIVNVVV